MAGKSLAQQRYEAHSLYLKHRPETSLLNVPQEME